MDDTGIGRREFLKGAAAAMVLAFAADEILAADEASEQPVAGPPVRIAVIGLGAWGREILTTLSRLPSAQAEAICDTYEPFVTRAAKTAPNAKQFADYRKLLELPEIEAVVVATPTHLHKQIVLDAVQAGKHVYCEAPLAATADDARAIALAGAGSKNVFQAGLQGRSNALYTHVESFVRAGCLGSPAQAYAQYARKTSWQPMAPTPEREKELRWRLANATSPGIVGELGIHQIDLANWYLGGVPSAVTGFGSITHWRDGRDVPDTVQCILEYPKGVRLVFMGTLANSFSKDYTLFQGSESSLVLREDRGWMVREADAPMLGWEVYAHKEQCFEETGICMLADATKILRSGGEPGKETPGEAKKTALHAALENFTRSVREGTKPACGPAEGYAATLTALKANEAVISGSRIACPAESFELG